MSAAPHEIPHLDDRPDRVPVRTVTPRKEAIVPPFARRNPVLCAALAVALLSVPAVASAQCFLSYAWTVSEDDNVIRRVALDGLLVEETIAIVLPGQTVTGITGVSIHPSTGDIWFLAYLQSSPVQSPFLMRYDVLNQFTQVIGNTVVDFISLQFTPDETLYAVSADTATPANSFCTLSLTTGLPTDVCFYGNGDTGEAIAHHPGDDQFYHASGALSLVFETEAALAMEPCDTISIDVSLTPLVGAEVTGLAWWPVASKFLWARTPVAGMTTLYQVDVAGAVTLVGTLDHAASDLAIVEVATPCPPGQEFIRGDANLDNGANIADVIFLLGSLFTLGAPQPECPDAADFNDDGTMNIADGIYLLNRLFVPGSPAPPPPFPDCGQDGTPGDALDCPVTSCP